MKKLSLSLALIVVFAFQALASVSLDDFLKRKEIKEVRALQNESTFERILEVMIEQPLDHKLPDGETFMQRIYISHVDPASPVVMITAGYDANYYYTSEITAELRCNQLLVEHRFFGKSMPENLDYDYLDTWQAASDHHRIVTMFKELYPEQWITTGISKGGQTVMYHSYYYPEDVDARVPYVAPLNYGVEDERIYSFLDQVGSPAERRKVRKFQKLALKNQDHYLEAFKELSEENGYTYELVGGIEKAYEYCVLEYSFAYWQWGYVSSKKIPGRSAGAEEIIEHMNRVAGFDYFSDQFIAEFRPFFYQALTETGYYGYDLDAFGPYLKHVENPIFTFTLPEEVDLQFNEALSIELQEYLDKEARNYIFIYGEYDTWSATAVSSVGDANSMIIFKEGGSHRTRIRNLPEEQQKEVYATLESFLQ